MKTITLLTVSFLCQFNASAQESREVADCPPMIYSNEVKAVLIRESACGNLNDVNIIRIYNGEGCGGTEMGVDMSKYTRFNENRQCPDGLEIVTYKRTEP